VAQNEQLYKEAEASPGEFAQIKSVNVVKAVSLDSDLSRNSVLEP
jgi:hypothetical protein